MMYNELVTPMPAADELARRIQALVAQGDAPDTFLRHLCALLVECTRSSSVELWVPEERGWTAARLEAPAGSEIVRETGDQAPSTLDEMCANRGLEAVGWEKGVLSARAPDGGRDTTGRVVVPLEAADVTVGWLVLDALGPDYELRREVEWFRRQSATLGIALVTYRVPAHLFGVVRRVVDGMRSSDDGTSRGGGDPAAPGELPSLAEVEAAHVRRVLEQTGGNRSAAARILGIDRKTLRAKLARIDRLG